MNAKSSYDYYQWFFQISFDVLQIQRPFSSSSMHDIGNILAIVLKLTAFNLTHGV
jgi:hypothetical protein